MATKSFSDGLRQYRRDVLELTQAQFALLLGMGVASINRYENGGSPTPAHLEYLNSIKEPGVLRNMLAGKEKVLGTATHARLVKLLKDSTSASSLELTARLLAQEQDNNLTGNQSFNLEKLKQMVIFFTQSGEWKTKLNKLLFYSDFFAYRAAKKSISGAKYVKGLYGPIPDRHEQLYAGFLESGVIKEREEYMDADDAPLEKLVAHQEFKRRTFSDIELNILQTVQGFFRNMTARRVADYSHAEAAYLNHEMGEPIPYSDAKALNPLPGLTVTSKRLSDLAREAIASIPQGALDHLPTNAATEVDEVLYGGPKPRK